MRKTCLGGILLLCVLAVAKPVNAAEQEALPAAQAVETAAEVAAQDPGPDENEKTPQGEPADISAPKDSTELKDAPEPDADSIPEDGSDLNNGSIAEQNSDLNSGSISENDSDLNSNAESGNNSDSAEKPEPGSVSEEEILAEEAVSDPNEQNVGVIEAQDGEAAMKQASNAATDNSANGTVALAEKRNEDRIHFITLIGERCNSDAILIESNGEYGLIDSSNPSNLNDIYSDKLANGLSVVNYLTDINIDHLKFVLGTHSHSDHIGGMPDIAASGLVDSRTVYI